MFFLYVVILDNAAFISTLQSLILHIFHVILCSFFCFDRVSSCNEDKFSCCMCFKLA